MDLEANIYEHLQVRGYVADFLKELDTVKDLTIKESNPLKVRLLYNRLKKACACLDIQYKNWQLPPISGTYMKEYLDTEIPRIGKTVEDIVQYSA